MQRTPRPYIDASGLMTKRPAFKWDGYPLDCQFEVPRLFNEIGSLYSRAVMAFAIGAAEWAILPLTGSGKDDIYADDLEACWAAVVDRRYLRYGSKKYAHRIRKSYKLSPNGGTLEDLWNAGDLRDPVIGPSLLPCTCSKRWQTGRRQETAY